jgi:hypothetical protein
MLRVLFFAVGVFCMANATAAIRRVGFTGVPPVSGVD